MKETRAIILSLATVLTLACSVSLGNPQAPAPAPQQTLPPLPTYTSLPTYTLPAPPVNNTPTATQPAAAPTASGPLLSYDLVEPDKIKHGNTSLGSELLYFNGQEGQTVSIVLIGEKYYQFFSIRDNSNEGLKGCDVRGNVECSIENYRLPYTGVYYILVDRTMDERWKKAQSCKNNPPYPDWCYRGGPYALTLTIQ